MAVSDCVVRDHVLVLDLLLELLVLTNLPCVGSGLVVADPSGRK